MAGVGRLCQGDGWGVLTALFHEKLQIWDKITDGPTIDISVCDEEFELRPECDISLQASCPATCTGDSTKQYNCTVGGGQGKQYGVNVQKIRNIIEQKTMRYYYDVTASTSNEKITESPNRIRRKAGRRKKPVDGLIQAKLDIFIGLNRSTPGLIVSGGGDKAGDVR